MKVEIEVSREWGNETVEVQFEVLFGNLTISKVTPGQVKLKASEEQRAFDGAMKKARRYYEQEAECNLV